MTDPCACLFIHPDGTQCRFGRPCWKHEDCEPKCYVSEANCHHHNYRPKWAVRLDAESIRLGELAEAAQREGAES